MSAPTSTTDHDEIDENDGRDEKLSGCLMLKMMYFVLLPDMQDTMNLWRQLLDLE